MRTLDDHRRDLARLVHETARITMKLCIERGFAEDAARLDDMIVLVNKPVDVLPTKPGALVERRPMIEVPPATGPAVRIRPPPDPGPYDGGVAPSIMLMVKKEKP